MVKKYVILYTNEELLVPIKALESPYVAAKKSYCATYPQFFGGTIKDGHTLDSELAEESQGKLRMGTSPERIYPGGTGGAVYTFYKSKIDTIPEDLTLSQESTVPKKKREFQAILRIPKTDFGTTKTVDKLVQICHSRSGAYCSDTDGKTDWDASETKEAFAAFLSIW